MTRSRSSPSTNRTPKHIKRKRKFGMLLDSSQNYFSAMVESWLSPSRTYQPSRARPVLQLQQQPNYLLCSFYKPRKPASTQETKPLQTINQATPKNLLSYNLKVATASTTNLKDTSELPQPAKVTNGFYPP